MLLPQRIATQCTRRPDATAVLHVAGTGAAVCNTTISYGQLHQQAAALGAALIVGTSAVTRTAVVAVLLDEAPGSVVAELGVLYAGAAFVPLDPGAPAARLRYQLVDCEACAVIHSRAQAALVQSLLEHEPETCGVQAVELETTLKTAGDPLSACAQAQSKVAILQASQACHVIYTSGSTGKPKGVICEHGALRAYAEAKLQCHGIDENARVLLVSAATWDPSVGDAFSTFACGATLVTAPRARLVQDLPAVLREGAVSHVCTTPALWGMLPATANWECFPTLHVVALGGERLPSTLIKQWQPTVQVCAGEHTRRLLNTYGVTEATVYQTVGECRPGDRPGMVGQPLPGVVCAVAAPPGEAGEIWISGPLLARGYLRAMDLNAQKFITVPSDGREGQDRDGLSNPARWLTPGRWFRTGDLGRWHGASASVVSVPKDTLPGPVANEPRLEVLGRIDSQIKLRGFRIELGEVESVLTENALIGDAAVVLHTDNTSKADASSIPAAGKPEPEAQPELEPELEPEPEPEPRLVAYITLCEGVVADAWTNGGAEVAVRVHCRQQLPVHAIPTQFVQLSRLPLTASGKVNRQALPKPPLLRSRSGLAVSCKRAMSSMETTVAGAWAAALCMPVADIGLEDNFFQLGGNSVKAVAMVKQLEVAHRQAQHTSSDQSDWSHHDPRVRYCALFRKPRLVEYAAFLEWVAVGAPTRSANDHSTFASRLVPSGKSRDADDSNTGDPASGFLDAEELLSLMDRVLPGADDEAALLNAALKRAAASGHNLVISALLLAKAHPDAGHTKKDRGDTPLILASGAGHTGAVRALILGGAAPNLPDSSARTAAHLLAGAGQVKLLRWMLIEGGASAEAKDVNKWSLAHFAAWHGRSEVLEMLLRLKAAQSLALAHERRQRTSGIFREVALQQQLGELRHDEHALLAHAPHLLPASFDGDRSAVQVRCLTAAALAAEESLGSILEWAAGRIQSGVRRDWSFVIDARDRWHRTPLSWAVFQNHAAAAQVLIDGGAKFDWRNPYPEKKLRRNNNRWNTSLHLAVQATVAATDGSNAAPTSATCTDGAAASANSPAGISRQTQTPTELTDSSEPGARPSRLATLRLLLQHPEVVENLDTADNDGRTPLHEAASLVFVDSIKAATQEAAAGRNKPESSALTDPDNVNCQIQGLMVQAAYAARLLLDAQASIDATDHAGRTPLHCAVRAGQTAVVEMLLVAGADATLVGTVDELLHDGEKPLPAQVSTIGRRARRDGAGNSGSVHLEDRRATSEVSRERLARRARLHELETPLRKVLALYASNEPLVASVLSARFEKVWGKPLKPKDYGYNKLSTLLRALPQLCEVSVIQSANSASAPTLLVKLVSSNTLESEIAEATEETEATCMGQQAPQQEDWPGHTLFRRQAADLLAHGRLG